TLDGRVAPPGRATHKCAWRLTQSLRGMLFDLMSAFASPVSITHFPANGATGQVRRLNENILLVASIIRELHIDSEVFRFETRNHLLQSIAIAPGHAEHIPLNRGLNLSLRILNVLHNILRFFLWDALLDLHTLT